MADEVKIMIVLSDEECLIDYINECILYSWSSRVRRFTVLSTKRGEIQRRLFSFSVSGDRIILHGNEVNAKKIVDTIESLYGEYPVGLKEK